MKLRAETEILEDRATNYQTKYQEIDQELIAGIRELCFIKLKNSYRNCGRETEIKRWKAKKKF